jgi:hypothetical protein
MKEMLSIFPDTRLYNDPYTVQFGSDDWSAVICRATGRSAALLAGPAQSAIDLRWSAHRSGIDLTSDIN